MPKIVDTCRLIQHLQSTAASGNEYAYRAFLRDTVTYVAAINLFVCDPAVPKWEIGYWRRKSFQGQGYISEAVRALTKMAFDILGGNRMQIMCDVKNQRSRRVAERSGYRLEAILENDKLTLDGELRDTTVYVCLPKDFRLHWPI